MSTAPFNRCYWADPPKLMAGCYPGSKNEDNAQKKLQDLIDHGIRHVINLMAPEECDHTDNRIIPYEPTMTSMAEANGLEITFIRMPTPDLSVPSVDHMVTILDAIDEKVNADKPVYVHCFGGRGRTGTVIGCYLARHGYAIGKRVPWMIQKLRKNVYDYNLSSPETHRQIEMIISWGKGE